MRPLDLARLRAETPGIANVVHFNNAGCALPPAPVVEAMIDHLRLESEIGGYEAQALMEQQIARPRAAIAALLNASPDEIALTENATRAWDLAFYALPLRPGDRILTGRSEYGSNFIAFLHRARREGVIVDVAPNAESGEISVEGLAGMVGPRTRLIAVTHVPTSGGLVNPIAAIGAVARAAGVPFLVDACQSAGQLPLDVAEVGCDFLSGTSRKFLRGPRGVGFLYVRRGFIEALDPPFLDDHAADWFADDSYSVRGDAQRFETPECCFAARIGLGIAVDYALAIGIPAISARVIALGDMLRARLADVPGLTLHDLGRERCGIVTFSLAGVSADTVKSRLARRLINVTVSEAEATRLDMIPRVLSRIVRASVHYYNSDEEVERVAAAIARIAREDR